MRILRIWFLFSHARDILDLTKDHVGKVCRLSGGCTYTGSDDCPIDPFVHYAFEHHKLAAKLTELNIDLSEFTPLKAGNRHLRPFT